MKWPWSRKKEDDELEKQGKEREVAISTREIGFRQKTIWGKKEKSEPSRRSTSKVIEETIVISPNHYEFVELGELQRGVTIIVECNEKDGENFSYFLMDEDTFKGYKKNGVAPKPLAKGSGEDEYKEKVIVKITGRYYLIITTRAIEYKRKVWYHVEIMDEVR